MAEAVVCRKRTKIDLMNCPEDEDSSGSKLLIRSQSMNIDSELANEVFDHFMTQAATLKSILRTFRYLCDVLRLKPQEWPYFYPKLKSKLTSWKANALWAKFDKRASHKVYMKGKACAGQRVLVIGAGPCGLRTAIEAQLLGAKVVVVEKRDRFSRNNVLHLWPYNIHDLRGLGAKKFYGKFCAGSIDHISIRALQCILLKVALLMGVEVFENCGFEDLVEPQDIEIGWKAKVSPPDHPVGQYEFDVLIGADGKRNTLRGFKRKEFRGKLAIAITANFINRHTEAEQHIEEISGVAFIFNQKFFNDLHEAKGIDLENIVYYKDETHYFVMTAKKQSLIDKGVITENEADTAKLLAAENINQDKLFEYAREAADFATEYQMPHLDFAVNHYGKPDVAMFDFTSMFQAENSCRVIERHGHRLLTALVGDSLLEPFWPTGTGCARGFFGGLDACWMMRTLALGKVTALEAIAERESIYKLLAQSTPANTSKDFASYTVDPRTRYPTLNTKLLSPHQVTHLVDTDNPSQLQEDLTKNTSTQAVANGFNIRRRKESTVTPEALLAWLTKQVESYEKVVISDMTTSFQNGLALCAIIHRYRPDLIDFHTLDAKDCQGNLQLAFEILDHELGISPVMKPSELADVSKIPDKLTMMSYLSQIYECFRREIPAAPPNNHNNMESIPEEDKLTLGQIVAKKAAKKRRSRENTNNDTKEDIDQLLKADGGESHNKENVSETARMNRSANRKRLLNLMQRAEQSACDKKKNLTRKSIKDEERYKIIEQYASGRSRRSGDAVTKYRENKKPKELKRAIGKIDKDDWNIKNIEEKLVINTQAPDSVKKDKVPKWSKAAFQDKFNIMKGKLENAEDEKEKKYSALDAGLAKLQRKLREGSTLETGERGSNRVSALAEELFSSSSQCSRQRDITDDSSARSSEIGMTRQKKSSIGSSSENCHFCHKRVYVVERMSAEGKFFHRSCFRCDYCNILLRLGSYVYHRDDGTAFSQKFFCIPHSTENALEKYRYRKKADELKDAENRKYSELLHRTNQEWAPNAAINRHRERLDPANNRRGATPERAEFEASIDQDSEPPSIMDEDEWTDRNFGGNSLIIIDENEDNNTSEDSVSDLESDEEDEEGKKPLTAKEARQLQREWLKRQYDTLRNGSDEEVSQYDNVKEQSSSEDEDEDADAEYEDSEYESDSESELDEGCSNIKLAVPKMTTRHHRSKKKSCPHGKKAMVSSTEDHDDDSDDSEDEDSDESESEAEDSLDDFSGSETNTECDFTDSEGRPNPFHKELEVPSILIEPGSPDIPGMRRYPEDIIEANTSKPNMNFSATKYQYKTPNLVNDLAKKETSVSSNYIGRSTQRAFNLKKHWVSDASNTSQNQNKTTAQQKSELDNRFKSLMDRLSNQQKLLKPADKPSQEMEHFIKRTSNSTVKSISTDPLITSPLKSPAVIFSRQMSENTGQKFTYPPPYRPAMSNGISAGNIQDSLKEPVKPVFFIEEPKKPETVEPVKEPEQDENPPPIPPIPDIYIEEHKAMLDSNSKEAPDEEAVEEIIEEQKENTEDSTNNTTFESCNNDEEEDDIEVTNEDNYLTPAHELSLNPEHLKDEDIPLADEEIPMVDATPEPVATSSPATIQASQENICSPTESEKSFIQKCSDVKLTDDEIMRIYQERNPLERLAKFNSLKQKQSSVVHNMILSGSGSSSRPRTRRTRVAVPSSSIPPIPIPGATNGATPITPVSRRTNRAATEPPMSLPATPLTDPAKFGIPVARNANKKPVVSEPPKRQSSHSDMDKLDGIVSTSEDGSVPNSPMKKIQTTSQNNQKKTFMQAISGIFRGSSSTRIASPEESISSPPPASAVQGSSNNNPTERKSRSDLLKFLKPNNAKKSPVSSPEAPRANLSEISNESSSSKQFQRQSSKLSLKASHPSTPPVPLSRKITIMRNASEESLSENDEETTDSSINSSMNLMNNGNDHHGSVPPEIMEKIMKRGANKSAKRASRVAHLKRVRKAQEIQRQLEELDVMHKELEDRGIEAERSLRGEIEDENENPDLLQTWFILLAEKNALVRHEQELLVQAKQLELEDRSSKLEAELRDHLLLDSKSGTSVGREAAILQELLSIAEQREKLQSMLERDKKRYMKEDQDIEAQMKAKGLRVTPVRKLSLTMLDTSSTA